MVQQCCTILYQCCFFLTFYAKIVLIIISVTRKNWKFQKSKIQKYSKIFKKFQNSKNLETLGLYITYINI